jgi:hypothetical protein
VAIGLVSAVSGAAADDGIDPHVLYQSRADSVELPELGVVISHSEGTVSIGGDSAGGALHSFLRHPSGTRGHNARHDEEATTQDAFIGETSA